MRIVEMQPREEPLGRVLLEPWQRGVDDFPARPEDVAERKAWSRPAIDVEPIVVLVEALIEAELRIEHECAHKGAGRIAAGFEALGQRRFRGVENVAAVVAHAMKRRGFAPQKT